MFDPCLGFINRSSEKSLTNVHISSGESKTETTPPRGHGIVEILMATVFSNSASSFSNELPLLPLS